MLLVKTNLNSIKILISKILNDSYISHNESILINTMIWKKKLKV